MQGTLNIKRELVINVIDCPQCGIEFGVTKSFEEYRRKDHETFYCPSGHDMSYKGKTDAQLLREERERAQQIAAERDAALREAWDLKASLNGALEEVTKAKKATSALKTRVSNGVCPDCHRTFKNVALHARSKHKGTAEAQAVAEEMKQR
jgi:hypothetical protein